VGQHRIYYILRTWADQDPGKDEIEPTALERYVTCRTDSQVIAGVHFWSGLWILS
jgi:hypothetical protein